MIYTVRQSTEYRYAEPVPSSRHMLRCIPASGGGQLRRAHSLSLSPAPHERCEEVDFFGNAVTAIAFAQPHDRLIVTSTARVEVFPAAVELGFPAPSWESVRNAAVRDTGAGPEAPIHGLHHSPAIPWLPEIADYAAACFAPARPVAEALLDLSQRIQDDFAYDPDATDVATPPAQAFAQKRGVCQDFAQVMLCGLRGLGLPALYVSGYLRTLPPPGQPRLVGADATHAWVSVWCGGHLGWRDFDPTNGVAVGQDHVRLAIGRHYAEVAPVDGIIHTAGGHTLKVSVDVAAEPAS